MYFLQTMVSAVLVSTASAASDIKAANADQPGNAIYDGIERYFTIGFDRVTTRISAKTEELRESTEIFLSCKSDTSIKFQLSEDGKSIWKDFHQSKKEFGLRRFVKNGITGIYEWIDAARFKFKNELAKVSWKATLVRRFYELHRQLRSQVPEEITDAIDAVERAAVKQWQDNIVALYNKIAAEKHEAKYERGINCALGYMEGTWDGELDKLRDGFMKKVKSLRVFDELPHPDELATKFKNAHNALLEEQRKEIETLRTKIAEYIKKLSHLDGESFRVAIRKMMYRRHVTDKFNLETRITKTFEDFFGTEPTRRRLMDAERIRKHSVLRELHQ